MESSGIIFNIQRYTIHDGPGIRTELFLKGCPLECRWCGNPESQAAAVMPGVYTAKCLGSDQCGHCLTACQSQNSLVFQDKKLVSIDRNHCTNCMDCAQACPADAIKQWGRRMTVDEAMEIVLRDAAYYQKSGGGVTVSGGEPLVQSDFLADFFQRCQEEGIHTCLESTFCMDWNVIQNAIIDADLLITDIKHMDPEVHRNYTGLSNERILANLKKISLLEKDFIIRIPVIPGVNNNPVNMAATADFIIQELGNRIMQLQLLGFMRLGEEKYASLGIPYPMGDVNLDHAQFNKYIEDLAVYFNDRGISCTAGTTANEVGGQKK